MTTYEITMIVLGALAVALLAALDYRLYDLSKYLQNAARAYERDVLGRAQYTEVKHLPLASPKDINSSGGRV
jgi:hypothetical protein